MIDEIKRIIKTSEIMKFVPLRVQWSSHWADLRIEKMMPNGPRRTKMGGRSWRSGWAASTSHSRWGSLHTCFHSYYADLNMFRLPKSAPSSMSQNHKIQRDSVSSIISSRIWRR